MNSFATKCWNKNCSFPKFQLLFHEKVVEPPTWFLEALLVAFIDDYENVTDFENVMKQWTNPETVKYSDRVLELFSTNKVALPYLILGLNSVYSQGKVNQYRLLIHVDKVYIVDFHAQKNASEGNLTIDDYVTRKVDFSAMIKRTYGVCLYAISLFRIQNKNEQYPTFTEKDVENFLILVFKNKETDPARNDMEAQNFFELIEVYCKKPDPKPSMDAEPLWESVNPSISFPRSKNQGEIISKERAFIESVFHIIRGLKGFQEYLLKFKDFVHDIKQFIEFVKKYESSMVTKGSIKEHSHPFRMASIFRV